jgi:type IV pilus assembly protein PilM
MPSSNVCWGIELGAGSIKALKLVRDGDDIKVADFALLPHKRVLSDPDIDPNDVMRVALGALVNQFDLSGATIAISAPGHQAFARFAKLPPAEPKEIPNIVKFEAVQQIPFPIEEVEWDYQTFVSEDSPDIEVGIFAITRERVMEKLAMCNDVDLKPDVLALSPVSAYNAIAFDRQFTEQTPGVVLLDIGTQASDLIVADQGRVWVRTFPLGGHQFTEAIASTFKLEYRKAERLKREAEKHEHKKHIFQAMRPVFADLAQDVQRSLAYYRQLHPESSLTKVIGMGSTFRLMGLRKFLSQQLQMDVVRLDAFERLKIEGARESDLAGATLNFATAYGLALQGLGMATINANLVPIGVLRQEMWKRKTPWFVAAAALALAAGGASFYTPFMAGRSAEAAQNAPTAATIRQAVNEGNRLTQAWREVENQANVGAVAENVQKLLQRRDMYAHLAKDIGAMFAFANERASGGEQTRAAFELIDLQASYVTPQGGSPTAVGAAVEGEDSGSRGRGRGRGRGRDRDEGAADVVSEFRPGQHGGLVITIRVSSQEEGYLDFVNRTLLTWLRDNAERADSPFVYTAPGVDQVQPTTISPADEGGRSRDRATQTTMRDRGGGGRAGGDVDAPQSLGAMAPLPPLEEPVEGERYEYQFQFTANLRAPGEHERAPGEQQAMAGGSDAGQGGER